MSEPSKRPWSVGDRGYITYEGPKGTGWLAECFNTDEYNQRLPRKANLEHIVRCVNSHDDLLAALKELRDMDFCESYNEAYLTAVLRRADAAIAKATTGSTP